MKFFVYVLRCADGSLYTGWTTDLKRRLRQHNGEIAGGAKYTAARRPCLLAHFEEFDTKSEAAKREATIKSLSKKDKETLIKKSRSDFYSEQRPPANAADFA